MGTTTKQQVYSMMYDLSVQMRKRGMLDVTERFELIEPVKPNHGWLLVIVRPDRFRKIPGFLPQDAEIGKSTREALRNLTVAYRMLMMSQ